MFPRLTFEQSPGPDPAVLFAQFVDEVLKFWRVRWDSLSQHEFQRVSGNRQHLVRHTPLKVRVKHSVVLNCLNSILLELNDTFIHASKSTKIIIN